MTNFMYCDNFITYLKSINNSIINKLKKLYRLAQRHYSLIIYKIMIDMLNILLTFLHWTLNILHWLNIAQYFLKFVLNIQ